LYTEYYTPVFRYLYRKLNGQHDVAEDLTQTVFLRVIKNIQNFKDLGKNPLVYFYTIARNLMIDHVRKQKRWHEVEYDDAPQIPSKDPNPSQVLSDIELKELLEQMLTTLPQDQSEALTLKYIEGFPNKEIADIMDKSEANIRKMQSRGLDKLRTVPSLHYHFPDF